MPPRIDILSRLRSQNCSSIIQPLQRLFSTTPTPTASTVSQKRRHQDPYAFAQARARKQANQSRQEVLKAERSVIAGDPVRGTSTPFIESFDTAVPVPQPEAPSDETIPQRHNAPYSKEGFLNYFVTAAELEESIKQSQHLTTPVARVGGSSDPRKLNQEINEHKQKHSIAAEALARIASLENSSSKDRTRINVQRCIETFGRHNTDTFLRPKPISTAHLPRKPASPASTSAPPPIDSTESPESTEESTTTDLSPSAPLIAQATSTPRSGPDTGSSEVQIAILTVKIRALANFLEKRGRNDKANKRNLRLLVHKRQKLLRYLRRKERGSERWMRVTEMCGLGEGRLCWGD